MTTKKFTEGAWEVGREWVGVGRKTDNIKSGMPNIWARLENNESCPKKIAILPKNERISRQEQVANARLIAAAPEMYELLSSCIEYAEYVEDYFGGKTPEEIPDAYHFIKSIDNLLARIDGEEQEHD